MSAISDRNSDYNAGPEPAFKAFISYSHKNDRAAKRLHRRLERYHIPKGLRTNGRVTLGAIFRDKVELSASSGLDKSIKAALDVSENLIVLCSPDAVQSRWVDEEIRYFKSLGRADRIFTVILSGEPFAQERGFDAAAECLPKSIRYTSWEDDDVSAERVEPLASDFRAEGDGEKTGTLKLISGLLGVGLNSLLQRQLVHARRRMMAGGVTAAMIVTALGTLTWTTYSAQQRAEDRRADAENFVEFLLEDLSQQLEGYGRLDLLDAVGEKAINYYTQFDETDFDAKANGRRARTLQFMGQLQYALGEADNAKDYFDQAYDITEFGLDRDALNTERLFEHARSAYLRSRPLRQKRDYEAELVKLQEYSQLSQTLFENESGSSRAISQLALAKMHVGRVSLKLGRVDEARAVILEADRLFQNLTQAETGVQAYLDQAENMAWLAESYRAANDYRMSYNIRVQQVALLSTEHERRPDDFRLTEGLVYATLGLGNAAVFMGRLDEGEQHFNAALKDTRAALRLEPNREKMRRAETAVLLGLMRVATQQGKVPHYNRARTALLRLQAETMTMPIKGNKYWDEVLPLWISDADDDFAAAINTTPP